MVVGGTMGSLTGLAQFTNRFAQGVMNYEDEKKKEAERLADKEYERKRQESADLRAQESHDLNQQQGKVSLENNQLTLSQNKVANDAFNNQTTYADTIDRVKYLSSIGADDAQSIDVISNSVNSNSKLPYTIEIERDQDGKIIARKDADGNTFYHQTIIDKQTGRELGRKTTTLDGMMQSYTQLQRGGAIEAEQQAAAAARAAKVQELSDELSLYTGKKNVDTQAYAINKGVDYNNDVSLIGIRHANDVEKLGVQHGYRVDELGIQHGYRIDEQNNQSNNRIGEYIAQDDVRSGGTPVITDRNTQVSTIIRSLTGTESSGNSKAFRTNIDGRSFGGLLQMGDARLRDYANANGTKAITASQFKNLSASQQQAINNWHINDLINSAQATGAVGKVINGVPVTLSGLVAVGHLGGTPGMKKFVQTNGKYNPKDQLGTSLTDYLRKHANAVPNGNRTVSRSVPALPRDTKKTANPSALPAKDVNSKSTFTARVDKNVNTAYTMAKQQLGFKANPAAAAYFTQAGTKIKQMASVSSEQEFLNLYGQAADIIIKAIPERDRRNLKKSDIVAIQHKILLHMAGASELGELKQMIYNVNPATKSGQGGQSAKLGALSLQGKPAAINPQSQQTMRNLNNLNSSIKW